MVGWLSHRERVWQSRQAKQFLGQFTIISMDWTEASNSIYVSFLCVDVALNFSYLRINRLPFVARDTLRRCS